MKKKILIALFCAGIAVPNVYAVEENTYSNNYSVITDIIKIKKVNQFITKTNNIYDYARIYMLKTGDINPTFSKLKNYFHLSDNVFLNFNKNRNFVMTVNNSQNYIKFSNIFDSKPENIIIKILKTSKKLENNAYVTTDNNSIVYKYDDTLIKFVNNIKTIPSTAYVSPKAPGDITKIWYQPDGEGNININKYDTVKRNWVNIGVLTRVGIVVDKPEQLNQYNNIAKTGQYGYVKNGNYLDTYVFTGSSWQRASY